jgi:hypothetical protein
MSFTDHLRRLDTEPTVDPQLLSALAKALRSRLHHAGLWDLPPSYLGYDAPTWNAALASGDTAEPVLDCYLEAIVQRYSSLREHLDRKSNVDGLVYLNIDRFLLARQKKGDPVGYGVFKNLEAVLDEMIDSGAAVAEGLVRDRLRNATVVRLNAAAALATADQIGEAIGSGPAWEQALPRQARIGKGAQRLLADCLRSLPAAGVAGFRVGDLVAVLKERVRDAHAARMRLPEAEVAPAEGSGKAVGEIIRIVQPDGRYEEGREGRDLLIRRLREEIEDLDVQERTREGLRRVFDELCQCAAAAEEVPSGAELARRLGIRHSTLWDHVQRLRDLARRIGAAC